MPVINSFYKTNHAPKNRSSAIKFTPKCSRFPGDCSYPYIPFQSSANFARRFIPDSPMICSTSHTHTLQSSARQFLLRFSNLLQDSSYPYSPVFCKAVHIQILQSSARPFTPRFSKLIDYFLYSTSLRSRAATLLSRVILHEWMAFYSTFLSIHRSGVLTALAWLVPHETAAVSAQVLCTPYNHAPRHFMQRHNLLQDLSYSYAPHVCRTVHTHTFQISAGQFIPIHSRLLKEQFIPLHFARQFSPASSSSSYVLTSFWHVILCFERLNV